MSWVSKFEWRNPQILAENLLVGDSLKAGQTFRDQKHVAACPPFVPRVLPAEWPPHVFGCSIDSILNHTVDAGNFDLFKRS